MNRGGTTSITAEPAARRPITIARAAQDAQTALEGLGREGRARLLDAVADSLARTAEKLIRTADEETGLGETRLTGGTPG